MAASGIAEHNEARRREMVYLRKAYIQRELKQEDAYNVRQEAYSNPGNPKMDAQMVDSQRRAEHARNAQLEYSAKLPNRYTSINYMSQW